MTSRLVRKLAALPPDEPLPPAELLGTHSTEGPKAAARRRERYREWYLAHLRSAHDELRESQPSCCPGCSGSALLGDW